MKFVEVVMELRELMSEQIELEKDPEYLHEIIQELSQRVRELETQLDKWKKIDKGMEEAGVSFLG